MKITFLKTAQYELDETIEYYDHESPGLGGAFFSPSPEGP